MSLVPEEFVSACAKRRTRLVEKQRIGQKNCYQVQMTRFSRTIRIPQTVLARPQTASRVVYWLMPNCYRTKLLYLGS